MCGWSHRNSKDTSSPCFRHKRRCPRGPRHTTKRSTAPEPHDNCNPRAAVALSQKFEMPGRNYRANSHSSYLASCHASCPAGPHVVPALIDAATVAGIRQARDTRSSRGAGVLASYAPWTGPHCPADRRSLSHERWDCSCRRERSYCCWREAEAHCAQPDSTEHWLVQPDYYYSPFRQPMADAVRYARCSPDSRLAPRQVRAQCSYFPALRANHCFSPSPVDFR